MTDRHIIKEWNIEEPPVSVLEDGCGCVSEVMQSHPSLKKLRPVLSSPSLGVNGLGTVRMAD